jgi:hypothetical protein
MESDSKEEERISSIKYELIADSSLTLNKMESPSLSPPAMMAMAPPAQPSPMPMSSSLVPQSMSGKSIPAAPVKKIVSAQDKA